MNLLFSGCSITYGDELQNKFKERFSKLVSDHFAEAHRNISECGISNDNIVRRTIDRVDKMPPDLIIMQFTVHQRIEWWSEDGKPHGFTLQRIKDQTQRTYYRDVYTDTQGAENLWKNMFLFDCYCKEKGLKYIPLVADHFDLILKHPDRVFEEGIGDWRRLCENIPYTFLHPTCLGTSEEFPENYAQGVRGGHPSAKGHKAIANKIIELIDAI